MLSSSCTHYIGLTDSILQLVAIALGVCFALGTNLESYDFVFVDHPANNDLVRLRCPSRQVMSMA
jgi:hypothetical protein